MAHYITKPLIDDRRTNHCAFIQFPFFSGLLPIKLWIESLLRETKWHTLTMQTQMINKHHIKFDRFSYGFNVFSSGILVNKMICFAFLLCASVNIWRKFNELTKKPLLKTFISVGLSAQFKFGLARSF